MTENTNSNPGCLSSLLSLFRGKSFENSTEAQIESLPYRLRDDFLSPAEFSFYKVLCSIIGTNWTIQSKVRLADIFFVARPNENAGYSNKIIAKHLDFLVCNSTTMKPFFGIELDDSSHQRSDRKERDNFLNSVFQAAGLPLLHFPVQREYSSRELAVRLKSYLEVVEVVELAHSENIYNSTSQQLDAPLCPKCGIPLVIRTASEGGNKGKQFYGCPNYPRCRETEPIVSQTP